MFFISRSVARTNTNRTTSRTMQLYKESTKTWSTERSRSVWFITVTHLAWLTDLQAKLLSRNSRASQRTSISKNINKPLINTKGHNQPFLKNWLSCFDELDTHGRLPFNQIHWWMISITKVHIWQLFGRYGFKSIQFLHHWRSIFWQLFGCYGFKSIQFLWTTVGFKKTSPRLFRPWAAIYPPPPPPGGFCKGIFFWKPIQNATKLAMLALWRLGRLGFLG